MYIYWQLFWVQPNNIYFYVFIMIHNILQQSIISRERYLTKIFQYRDAPIIKVITGMRRSWKSFLLKNILQKAVNDYAIPPENIFYVDKELFLFDDIVTYRDLDKHFQQFLQTIQIGQKIVIAIDEVQEIQQWEKIINSYLSSYAQNAEIFITGSNSTMLSSELSTLLTGRYVEIGVFPLDLEEYTLFSKKPLTRELFEEYLQYGGLPGMLHLQQEEAIYPYLKDIYATILLKDIVKYFWVRNVDFFEDLYRYTFANIGNIVNAKSISDYLKSQRVILSPDMVLNYLGYGTKSYLLNKIKSVNPDTKRYFEIYNKYYVWDIGLRNAIVGYDRKKDIWKLIENYVFLELKKYGYEIKVGRLSSWKEIDFVAEKHGIIKYFQVCYLLWGGDTMAREYAPLEEINDNREKFVVSFDEVDFWISEGIRHINVMDLSRIL